MRDHTREIESQVSDAFANRSHLEVRGGGSKAFYGRTPTGSPLDIGQHRGVINYQPKELVLTARSGTPLTEIYSVLAEESQMLAFEPPGFGDQATLGGTLACGFSGPRRPYSGSCRDFVLGVRIINGRGEILRFGGEVMKNVAGYDVSRLMTGALGTLGVILNVSLKVIPVDEACVTLVQRMDRSRVIGEMNRWARQPIPLSAASYVNDQLYLRLSGTTAATRSAHARIGGDQQKSPLHFWSQLREHQHRFFTTGGKPLWRLSLPATAPWLELPGEQLIDWGGAQRWLRSDASASTLFEVARKHGGHATLFRGGDRCTTIFQPLPDGLGKLHRRVKQAFDPAGILNPGRMYQGV